MGDIHTDTVEGIWSLLKRGIGGVFHAVSQEYWQPTLTKTHTVTIGAIRGT